MPALAYASPPEEIVDDTRRYTEVPEKVVITRSAPVRYSYAGDIGIGSLLPEEIQSEATESGVIMIDQGYQRPDWYVAAEEKFKSLASLPAGWNSYGAEPPSANAIASARSVVEQLAILGIQPTKVGASAQDGVIVCISSGIRYADVECYNTGEIVTTTREKGSEPIVSEIEASNLIWFVNEMVDYLAHG
jgi:hypothetical protein